MIQLQVLNYILDSKDFSVVTLNNLDNSFFSDYTSEFGFIKDHYDTYGNVPDKETFLSKFIDFDVVSVLETPQYLIKELFDDRNKRHLAKVFNKVRDLIQNDKTEEALSLYLNATSEISTGTHLECVDILKDTSRFEAYVDRCNDFGAHYVPTGFPQIDEIIGGWDRSEELATIIARTGTGKSWALLKAAVAAAEKGLTVGIYSGEMSENKVGYRIDTLISHISNGAIMHGNAKVQNDYKKYIDELPTKLPGSIKVLTPAMINGTAGVNALRAFIEKENLDILCIDQHSLLDDDRKAKNPVERASNISKDLKTLQVLKKIPIVSVCQQNRNSTEDGISTSHIAQSDRIAQDSTVIIALEQKDGILTVDLIKSRDAVNGKKIKYALDFDKGLFEYIPEESNGLNGEGCSDIRKEFEDDNTFSGGDYFG